MKFPKKIYIIKVDEPPLSSPSNCVIPFNLLNVRSMVFFSIVLSDNDDDGGGRKIERNTSSCEDTHH